MESLHQVQPRPSRWWLIVAALGALTAIAAAVATLIVHAAATRPIGEGDLFLREASEVARVLEAPGPADLTQAIKHIRNELEVEAASIVSPDGTIVASSSGTLVGTVVDNAVVGFGHASGVFAAAAMPIAAPIEVDGVVEWSPNDTLYAVVQPVDSGQSLLLHYDISELLARRSQGGGVSGSTLVLAAVAIGALAVVGIALLGRSRARTRFLVIERESAILRSHAEELEQRNRELDEARADAVHALGLAEEKNRIRGEFVMMINHELRTPLTSMVTGAQILAEGGDDPESQSAIVHAMLDDGKRLERMISQILAVARVENRGLNPMVVDTDCGDVWRAVVEDLGSDADTIDQLALDTAPVKTDTETVVHIVAALTANATQHGASTVTVSRLPGPSIDPQVAVGSVDEPAMVISVRDDGPGIAPEFLPRIFEKFEKDSFSSGTGLGLYVVRLMADAIGSSVSVATGPDGTVCEVAIPGSARSATVVSSA